MDERTLPEPDRDPVCDMIVDMEEAEAQGLTCLHESVAYGFCSKVCLEAFAKDPQRFVPAGGRDAP